MGNSESNTLNDSDVNGDTVVQDVSTVSDNGSIHHEVEDDYLVEQENPFDGIETLGYRVLGVQPNSPAAVAGLVSFLDFLVGVNGDMLLGSGEDLEPGEEYDDVDLPQLLTDNIGKELEFLVWNIKSQSARLVLLTPSNDWGGAGLLGVTIRLDDYAGAEDRLVRILTVEEGSPAEIAGLQSETDFLLGTTHQTLDSVDRLASAVLQPNVNRVVELYVYNTETDMVRVVALMPTNNWKKGRGLLGAEVGTGYLHRLPSKTRETEGSSLERKVRYVDVKVDNSDGAATAHPSSSPLQQRRLELEPQLEMEPPSSDDDVDLPHTPLKEAASMPENNLCRQDEKKVATEPIPDTKAPARAPSSYGLQPHEVQAIFQKPPPVQDIAVTSAAPSLQHNFSGGYHSNDNLHYQQSSPSHLYGGPAPPHIVPQPQQPTNQIAVPVQHSPYSALPSHKSSQHTFPSPVYGSGYGNAPIPTYQPKTSPPPPQQPQPPPYAGTTSNHQQSFPNRMNPFSMTAPPRSFSNNIQYGGGGGVADAASPPNTTNNNNNNNNSSNAGN